MPGETEKPSAGGLLERIGKSLGFGPKRAPEAQASSVVAPPPAGEAAGAPPSPIDLLRGAPAFVPTAETPDLPPSPASLLPPVLEEVLITDAQRARDMLGSNGAVMNAAQAEVSAPAPAPIPGGEPRDLSPEDVRAMYEPAAAASPAEVPAPSPAAELPDWLTSTPPAASDLPDWMRVPASPVAEESSAVALPPAEAEVPAQESPSPMAPMAEASAPPMAETEKNPEQSAIEQFEEALLAADESLTKLRGGETLDDTQLRTAKAAAAKANGVIRSLPEHYLRVLLASRRLGENRDYTRIDFQKDMLAAIRAFSQIKKG